MNNRVIIVSNQNLQTLQKKEDSFEDKLEQEEALLAGLNIPYIGDLEDRILDLLQDSALSDMNKAVGRLYIRNRGKLNILELAKEIYGKDIKKYDTRVAKVYDGVRRACKIICNILILLHLGDFLRENLCKVDYKIFELGMLGYTYAQICEKLNILYGEEEKKELGSKKSGRKFYARSLVERRQYNIYKEIVHSLLFKKREIEEE